MAYSLTYSYNSATSSYSVTGYSNITTSDKVVIPDTYNDGTNGEHPVTSINSSAFGACYNLTNITIPDSVTSIGGNAFNSCTGLKSVIIPDRVTDINNYTFWYCTSLTSVIIPNGVTRIGDSAFGNCSSLTSVIISDSVTSIGISAFVGCTKLIQLILFTSTPPTLGSGAIPTTVQSIYVQQSSKAPYQTATNWTAFASKIVSDNIYLSFVRFNQKNKEYINEKFDYLNNNTGAFLEFFVNNSTFVLTATLKNANGDILGTPQTVDLPIESVVVDGTYNNESKTIILTLQNGNTVDIPVADLVDGLSTATNLENGTGDVLIQTTDSNQSFKVMTDGRVKVYGEPGEDDDAVRLKDIAPLKSEDIRLAYNIYELREASSALETKIDDIYNILGQTVITDTEVEDTYSSRVTADGADIVDELKTKVSKIKGSSMYSGNTLINAKFKGIKSHGRNLFEMSESLSTDKLTITKNSDGSFTLNANTSVSGNVSSLTTEYYDIFIPKGTKLMLGGTCTEGYTLGFLYHGNTIEAGLQSLMLVSGEPIGYDCYGIALEITNTTATEIVNATVKDVYVELSSESLTSAYVAPKTTDSSFMLDSAVELKCGDYIDVENQQVVRKTATKTFTNYGIDWWWAFNASKGIYAYTIYSSDTITVAMGNDGNNAACIGYSHTSGILSSAPNMSFKFDPKNKYFYFKNTAYTTLEAWRAHLVELYEAGTPLTITYETAEVQSTEAISIPTQYTAYKNGAEIIVSVDSTAEETPPTQCTVTQNYYVKSGV